MEKRISERCKLRWSGIILNLGGAYVDRALLQNESGQGRPRMVDFHYKRKSLATSK